MDYQALEGLGGRTITVVKRGVNIANVLVTVVPLTLDQLNAIGIMLPPDTTIDPAECTCMSCFAVLDPGPIRLPQCQLPKYVNS